MSFILTDLEVQTSVGGSITKKGWAVTGVSIDSRTIKKGELFVAIKSQRDGHEFLQSAICNGAAAAIVTRIPFNVPKDFPCIVVNDSIKALHAIARFTRERFKGKLVAVTGSVGKTSTKSLLTEVLSKFGKTHCSPKSFNNYLGVPLTLANIPLNTQYVICEIGMNSAGEIEPLSKMTAPDVAIITNISSAHLAAFGDLAAIAREKSMICSGLVESGLLISPSETPFSEIVIDMVKKKKVRHLTFGSNCLADIYIKKVSFQDNRTSVYATIKHVKSLNFELGALGYHHASNCLTVLGIIVDFNLNLDRAINLLKNWQPMPGRGKFRDIKIKRNSESILIRVIDESYNCNPASLKASLEAVKNLSFQDLAIKNDGHFRRIAVLGDMLELGSQERKFHRDIGKLESINCFDVVHCVGTLVEDFYQDLPESKKGSIVKNPVDLMPHILDDIRDRDVYIIKGSNSIGLSFIVAELCDLNGKKISR